MDNSITINLRLLILGISVIPVVSCFVCVFFTFVTKSSLVYAAAMADCPVSSSFPTVSVSIGPWEPQRLIWNAAMIINIPTKVVIAMLYPTIWPHGKLRRILTVCLIAETCATALVSIFHVQSIAGEGVHAACFVFWSTTTFGVMSSTVALHRLHAREKMRNITIVFGVFLIFTVICALSHPISTTYCYQWLYAIFCLSEYSLMLTTAAFWVALLTSLAETFDRVSLNLLKSCHKEPLTELPSLNPSIACIADDRL